LPQFRLSPRFRLALFFSVDLRSSIHVVICIPSSVSFIPNYSICLYKTGKGSSIIRMGRSLYVLELEGGKYYIGTANKVSDRWKEHKEGIGSAWTSIHRPLRILEVFYP
jgi:hypothetical protein